MTTRSEIVSVISFTALSSEEGRRQLRSADSRTCVVRRTYRNFGDRCFAVAGGPTLWNSLPAGLRKTNIRCEQFNRLDRRICVGVEIVARSARSVE